MLTSDNLQGFGLAASSDRPHSTDKVCLRASVAMPHTVHTHSGLLQQELQCE